MFADQKPETSNDTALEDLSSTAGGPECDRLSEIVSRLKECEGEDLIFEIEQIARMDKADFNVLLPAVLSCLERSAQYEAVVSSVLDALYLQSHYQEFRNISDIVSPLAKVIDNEDYSTKTHSYAARVMAEAGNEEAIETLLDRLTVPGISTTIRYGLLEYGERQTGIRGFMLRRQIVQGLKKFDASDSNS